MSNYQLSGRSAINGRKLMADRILLLKARGPPKILYRVTVNGQRVRSSAIASPAGSHQESKQDVANQPDAKKVAKDSYDGLSTSTRIEYVKVSDPDDSLFQRKSQVVKPIAHGYVNHIKPFYEQSGVQGFASTGPVLAPRQQYLGWDALSTAYQPKPKPSIPMWHVAEPVPTEGSPPTIVLGNSRTRVWFRVLSRTHDNA